MIKSNYEEIKRLVMTKTKYERMICLINFSTLLNRNITKEEATKFENEIFEACHNTIFYRHEIISEFLHNLGFNNVDAYNKAESDCIKYLNIVNKEVEIINTKISEREHLKYLLRRNPTDAELTKYARNIIFLQRNKISKDEPDCYVVFEAEERYKQYIQGKEEALKRAKSRYSSLSTYDKSFYGQTYGTPRWSEMEIDNGIDFGFLDILYTEHDHSKEENLPKTYDEYFHKVDDKKRIIEEYNNAGSLNKIIMRLKGEDIVYVTKKDEEVDRIGNCYFLQYKNLDICVLKEEDLKSVKQFANGPWDTELLEPKRTISIPEFKEEIPWTRYGIESTQFGDFWTVVEYIGNGLYRDTITDKVFSYGIRETEADERIEELREYPLGITISWDNTYSDRNRPNLVHVDEPLPLTPKMEAEISKTKILRHHVKEMIDNLEENARKVIEEKYGSKVKENQLTDDLVPEINIEQTPNDTEARPSEIVEKPKYINSEEEIEYIENEDEKEVVLKKIRENPQIYKTIDGKYRKDPDVALEAVIMDGLLLEFVSEKLKNDNKIVKAAIESNPMALKFVSNQFKNDFDTVMYCVKRCGISLQYASPNIRRNPEIVLEAVRQDGLAIEYADSGLFEDKKNKNIVMEAVSENGRALKFVKQFKDERDVVLKAVKQNGLSITFADSKYFDDEEIVIIALNQPQCKHLAAFISERLQSDLNFMKRLGEIDRSYLRYASPKIKDLLRIELLKSAADSLDNEEIENNNSRLR